MVLREYSELEHDKLDEEPSMFEEEDELELPVDCNFRTSDCRLNNCEDCVHNEREEMNYCEDCKWYIESDNGMEFAKCKKAINPRSVAIARISKTMKDITYLYCENERDDDKCKNYEEKK